MSIEVEFVSIPRRQLRTSLETDYTRTIGRFVSAAIAGVLVIVLVSGCSSRNPDALTGSNLDENAAMMNAGSNFLSNTAASNIAESDASSSPSARSLQPSETPPSKGDASSRSEAAQQSRGNEGARDATNEPASDENIGNAVANDG